MSDILEMRRIIHLHGSAHFTIPLRLLDEPNVAVSVLTKLTPQSFNKRTKNIFTDLIRDLNIFILKSQKRDTYSRTLKRFFRITFPRLSLKIKQKNQHFHKSCWSTRCKNLPLPQYTFFLLFKFGLTHSHCQSFIRFSYENSRSLFFFTQLRLYV